ncbi:helix-turn-helix domain-containing protein [Streptomyces sp. CA-106110]|uniref:helix-turn-helix domain-containing protein n=1 Tax=Streptomyces sp. CA-106131 TaxID=3240045 RepID=UPI003D90C424
MHLVTADETARACPSCGTFALRVKGLVRTRPRDLSYGERGLELAWLKRRWYCHEPDCVRKSFTEQVPQIPAGARITARLRRAAALRVRDAGSTVVQAARDLHVSWPTVMSAFRTASREVTDAELPEVEVLGVDELRELGGGGFLGGQAGDGVDGLDGGPAGFAVGAHTSTTGIDHTEH